MSSTAKEIEIEIDKGKVYRYMGYDNGRKPKARIASLVDEYVENAYDLIQPSFLYTVKDIDLVYGSIILAEGSVLQSDILSRLLKRCQKVAFFVCTIHNYLENMSRWLAKNGDMLQASCLDAIGSDAIQHVADFVHMRVGRLARFQNMVVSRRLSPGWCDWDIQQQREIFQAVDGDSIGVHLTEDCLMTPRKSVSCLIGLGPSDSGVDTFNPCKTCSKTDCAERII